jgi:streptogramin lyase
MQWAPASSASSSAVRRSPKYLAPTALSVSIQVVSAPSPWTTATPIVEVLNAPSSTITFSAPTGLDTFLITTFDEQNALGNVLSKAYVTQTVSSSSANVVAATLNGVIASLALAVSPLQPVAGTASTMTVSATGYDADGNVIVGPGTYASPIALSIVDPANSGSLSLSSNVLQQPGATSTLAYNGKILASASVSASLSGVNPASVTIAPTPSVTVYPLPNAGSVPDQIAVDASNNLWFTEYAGNRIGELPNGTSTFTEHSVPTASSNPDGIAVGLDGRIWFTEIGASKIGAMTTSGSFTEFATQVANDEPELITERGDGVMSYTGLIGNDIESEYETGGPAEKIPLPTADARPVGIAVGPNGLLYFAENNVGKIGSVFIPGMEGASSPSEYLVTLPASDGGIQAGPTAIVAGPDGNMWFTDENTSAIGRFSTTNFSVVEYATPTQNSLPYQITVGTDGALWFTELEGKKIGRITTGGAITEYSVPGCGGPQGIAVRSNGVVWVTCPANDALARLLY